MAVMPRATLDVDAAVVGEYLRAHFRGRPFNEEDWAT